VDKDIELYKEYVTKRQNDLTKWLKDPHILVVRSHSTEYFSALSIEDLYQNSLFLLKYFRERGYINYKSNKQPIPPPVDLETFESMPECNARTVGISDWRRYEKDKNEFAERILWEYRMQYALEYKDGTMAYQLLNDVLTEYNPSIRLERIYFATQM
jgi:hypothetical protein